jgi:ornithine--oxo-acid transaminase
MAMEFHETHAYPLADKLRQNGLLLKPSTDHLIKWTPPLIITEKQIEESVSIFKKSLKQLF